MLSFKITNRPYDSDPYPLGTLHTLLRNHTTQNSVGRIHITYSPPSWCSTIISNLICSSKTHFASQTLNNLHKSWWNAVPIRILVVQVVIKNLQHTYSTRFLWRTSHEAHKRLDFQGRSQHHTNSFKFYSHHCYHIHTLNPFRQLFGNNIGTFSC